MGRSKPKGLSLERIIYPPENFHLSEIVFRPSEMFSFDRVPGLQDRVLELLREGRARSALDVIFEVLDGEPDNEHALRLAMDVVGKSRTEKLQLKEPITPTYFLDRRLDSIFAVCSHCKKSVWVPDNCLLVSMPNIHTVNVIDPIGLQCYHCGYVLCRECQDVEEYHAEYASISNVCPNCEHNTLKSIVFPTGRPVQQLSRRKERVVQMIVFREGVVPPDKEYMKQIIAMVSPDTLEDQAELIGVPLDPWPSNTDMLLYIDKTRDRKIKGNIENREAMNLVDKNGNKVCAIKVWMSQRSHSDNCEDTGADFRKTIIKNSVEEKTDPNPEAEDSSSIINGCLASVMSFIKNIFTKN